jgi:hypothetical protein
MATVSLPDDEHLLDRLQRGAFGYFTKATNPANGLVADTSREGAPVSIAVQGFALAVCAVAVERGWIAREEAVARILAALRFLDGSDQGGSAEATGYKGFYYHFLDARTGTRVWRSEVSMIDTALLIAGALAAAMYFDAGTPGETELRERADALYRRVDWRWAQGEAATIRQGWKPECGFLHYGWEGYSEAMLLYVLALASPSHPIDDGAYEAWTATYQWENLYGHDVLYAGPLFIHQFSHAWIDLRGIRDRFMREKRADYFENSRRATYVQREYARRNPHGFAGYGDDCWGLTAGDGPGDELPDTADTSRRWFGYTARGVPWGPDDGTLSCPAVVGSMPFAPEIVLPAVRHMTGRYPGMAAGDQLASGFNPSLDGAEGQPWVSPRYGLDQGLVVMMIENHRTQLIWRLMRKCPHVTSGLRRAGFRGGWLQGRAGGPKDA